jgi:hypothetical protein
MMADEIIERLKYIAESPSEEFGGFHAEAIATARDAITEITRLRAALFRLANAAGAYTAPGNSLWAAREEAMELLKETEEPK